MYKQKKKKSSFLTGKLVCIGDFGRYQCIGIFTCQQCKCSFTHLPTKERITIVPASVSLVTAILCAAGFSKQTVPFWVFSLSAPLTLPVQTNVCYLQLEALTSPWHHCTPVRFSLSPEQCCEPGMVDTCIYLKIKLLFKCEWQIMLYLTWIIVVLHLSNLVCDLGFCK